MFRDARKIVLITSILSFIVVYSLIYFSFHRQIVVEQNNYNENVSSQKLLISNFIQSKINEIENTAKILSTAYTTSINNIFIEQNKKYLLQSDILMALLYMFDEQGKYEVKYFVKTNNQVDIHHLADYQFYKAYWYNALKYKTESFWTSPCFDTILQRNTINYITKLYNSQNIQIGLLACEIDLIDLHKKFSILKNNYIIKIILTNSDNQIIYHTDFSFTTKLLDTISLHNHNPVTLSNNWRLYILPVDYQNTYVFQSTKRKYVAISIITFFSILIIVFLFLYVILRKNEKEIQRRIEDYSSELKIQNEELQSAKTALEKERNYIARIVDNQSEGFMIFDNNGEVNFVNKAILNLLQIKENDILGKKITQLLDKQTIINILKNIDTTDFSRTYQFEIPYNSSNGQQKHLVANLSAIQKDKNQIELLVFLRDITKEKEYLQQLEKTNQELRRREQHLEMTLAILEQNQQELLEDGIRMEMETAFAQILKLSVDANLSLSDFLQQMLEIILKLPFLNVLGEKGGVFVLDKNDELHLVAQKNLGPVCEICKNVKPYRCVCGKAFAYKKIIFKSNLDQDHDITFDGITDHGHYAVPFTHQDEVLGLLIVYLEPGYKQKENEIIFLENLSVLIGSHIYKHNLNEKVKEQAKILNQQVIELKKFQKIIEQTPATIVITDHENHIEYVNPYFTKTTGYTFEEALGKDPRILKSTKTNPQIFKELWQKLNNGEIWEGEFVNLKKDKTEYIEKAIIAPIINDGKIINYIAIKIDITEQKQKDQALKDLYQQLQNTISNLKVIYLRIDKTGKIIDTNRSMFIKTGFHNLDEINNYKILGDFPSYAVKTVEQQGKLTHYEIKIRTREGKVLIGLVNLSPWFDFEDQFAGAEGIITDITVEKELQEELIAANEQLANNLLIIEKQKQIIAENHNNLLENINYAKRIQESLIPSKEILYDYFDQAFLLFMPRDIVSGDFYYLNQVHDKKIVAVGDCTGHGVSGAFMTILSITFLQQIISQNIISPEQVLEHLRHHIKNTFRHFGNENPNSLEMIICTIDTNNTLLYSGAGLQLIIIRDNNLIEIKPTKCPVGFFFVEPPFELHTIQILPNDTIYLFSDGYKDQIRLDTDGYEKFGIKRFRSLLLEISQKSMQDQKQILKERFKQWQSRMKQIDDITILGIKF